MPGTPSPFGTYKPSASLRALLAVTRQAPATWLGRQRAFAARRVGIKLLGGMPADVETLGVQMRLYPYQNVCEKRLLFTPQYFDAEERKLLAERITDDFRFIDIGANVGAYALFVGQRAGPRAKIVAVEPQPEVFDRLTSNIAFNGLKTVKAVACAVSDKAGEVTLFLDPGNKGEASLKSGGGAGGPQIKVPAVSLQGLMAEEGFDRLDAIKIDVEGAEDIILVPFLNQAPQHLWPSLIVIEDSTNRWQVDLPRLLATKGYAQIKQTRLNLVYARKA
jgi:FkbM family methyltransferase